MSLDFRQAEAIIRKLSADNAAQQVLIEQLKNQLQSIVNPQQTNKTELYKLIATYFSNDELMLLCAEVGVNWSDLGGDGKTAKAYHLVEAVGRLHKTYQLISECQRLRPHVEWPG